MPKTVKRPRGSWPCRECRKINVPGAIVCTACRSPKPFKRGGTHRVECDSCACYGYLTMAILEDLGEPPQCLRRGCDGVLVPASVELALLLGVDTAVVRAFEAKTNSVAHGQAWNGGDGSRFESPEFRALYGSKDEPGIVQQQRQQSRRRRLAALMPVPEAIPF